MYESICILLYLLRFPFKNKIIWIQLEVFVILLLNRLIEVGLFLLKHELESEGWPLSWLWFEGDATIILFDDQLCNHESKTNAFGVHLLRVAYKAKKLEKLSMILLVYANACVNYRYLEESVLVLGNNFHLDLHETLLGELEGIWLNSKEHLHNPLVIPKHERAVSSQGIWLISLLIDINKLCCEVNVQVSCFLPLDAHDFLNALPDVKLLVDLSEFVRLDLCIIKHILHYEAHDIGWRLLDFNAILQFLYDFNALLGVWLWLK